MPLISMVRELKKAQTGGYAVPCFDTFDMMGTAGIIAALEARRAPGIIGLYTRWMEQREGRAFVQLVRAMAEDATVPVSLVLDHGASFEHCVKALALGFSDVMYDGSKLPLDENIAQTKLIVRAAHALGAGVEAELGHVGSGHNYQSFGALGIGFTEPTAAERFVAETGVDALAIAIGTAHGQYQGEPRLALDLLAEIRARVAIPLVLHGGSGLTAPQFRSAIEGGVAKINIFTDLAIEARDRLTAEAGREDATLLSLLAQVREGFQHQCERHIDMFSAAGKAIVDHNSQSGAEG